MNLRFDENDDLVVEDIPDDIMRRLEERAELNRSSVEDEMRELLIELSRQSSASRE